MISQSLNDTITRAGPDTPAGKVLRHYWQPAALEDELKRGLPLAVNLMGERLALVKDELNELKLVTRVARQDEPVISYPKAHEIAIDPSGPIYPASLNNGIVFGYLGPGSAPEFPAFDCFRAPDTHTFAFKGLWSCNWLQAMEIGIDPAHASFLHRFLEDEDPEEGYGKQFRDKAGHTDKPITQILREYPRPDIDVEETEYGLKITALRHMDNNTTHVRVTNQIFPAAICIPMSREMMITQWHVPVDDENCYWYTLFTSFQNPIDKATMREQRLKEHRLPDYRPLKNKQNNYHYNPQEQASQTYTGMGFDINVHDQWAVEGMGAIQDRTREHLGRSDVAIIRYRRLLRKAIASLKEESRICELPMLNGIDVGAIKGPLSNDAIASTSDWDAASHQADLERRAACPWNAAV